MRPIDKMTYLEYCFSILKILNIRGYSSSDILFVRIAGLQCIAHDEGDVPKIILVIQHLSTSPFVQQARLSIRSLANHDHYSVEIRIAIFPLASLHRLWPCSRRKSYFNHIWATCGRELQRKIDLSSYAFFQQGNFSIFIQSAGFCSEDNKTNCMQRKTDLSCYALFKNFLFPI